MVECELVYHKSTFSDNKSFNRYMVECECIPITYGIWRLPGFNRYMVECEYTRTGSESESATEF